MRKNLFVRACMALGMIMGGLEASHGDNNYLTPIGRVAFNPHSAGGAFAFSLMAEGGVRNWRVNGTAATWTTEQSRLKVGGEYLDQQLSWKFNSDKERRWVQQGALAAVWEYLLDGETLKAVDFKGFYSRSPSKHLQEERHIAGAQNYGGAFTSIFVFNETSTLDLSVIYDFVRYRRHFQNRKVVAGFGGGFTFRALLPGCVRFTLQTEFRRPYNLYAAALSWPESICPGMTSGIFASYTRGKEHLPNVTAIGLEFVFSLGGYCHRDCNQGCDPLWDPCDIALWASLPAIYSPEVLAIGDRLILQQ